MAISLSQPMGFAEPSWNAVPIPLLLLDDQAMIVALNDLASAWFGIDRSRALPLSVGELLPKLDLEALSASVATPRDALNSTPVHSLGSTVVTNKMTGDRRIVDVTARPGDAAERRLFVLALGDTTHRHLRERQLRRYASRLREAVHNAPIGMAICDVQGRFNMVNDALCALVSYPCETLLGLRYTDLLMPDESSDTLPDPTRRGDKGDLFLNTEYLCQTGSGERIWLGLSLAEVSPSSRVEDRFLILTAQDVSRLRESQEMLVRVQKMDVVGQLSGGIAHDFNNLLTVVIGNLQLIHENDDPAKRIERINNAVEAAERGAALTKRLLAVSRHDQPCSRLLDINATIAALSMLLEQSAGGAVQVEFRPGVDIWAVRIDPARFESALLNLAVNARDAMPRGGHLILETRNLKLARDDPVALASGGIGPGYYVEVVVSDNGSGMSPQVCERIFEPFFTTKSDGNGTGLGLTMVHRFVTESGGAIKVYSAPGQGTTFRIYLPRAQLRQGERDPSSAEQAIVRPGSETILVVDDDSDVRKVSTAMLQTLGYRTLEADSGEEAVDLLSVYEAEIDLLFTDVVMGRGMSGPELAVAAQRIRPGIKVLFTSGYTKDAFDTGSRDGPVELLSKPYLSVELAQRVRDLLDA